MCRSALEIYVFCLPIHCSKGSMTPEIVLIKLAEEGTTPASHINIRKYHEDVQHLQNQAWPKVHLPQGEHFERQVFHSLYVRVRVQSTVVPALAHVLRLSQLEADSHLNCDWDKRIVRATSEIGCVLLHQWVQLSKEYSKEYSSPNRCLPTTTFISNRTEIAWVACELDLEYLV